MKINNILLPLQMPLYSLSFIVLLILFPFQLLAQNDSLDKAFYQIVDINIKGNKKTKKEIILRELNIQVGDYLKISNYKDIIDINRRRILNLNLFAFVNQEDSIVDNTYLYISYTVHELLYWEPNPIFDLADRNVNVWWVEMNHKLNRTNIGLELTRTNFRGRNELLGGMVQLGYNKYFKLFYKTPNIDKKLHHGLGFAGIFETGRETFYNTKNNKLQFFSSENYPYSRAVARVFYSYRNSYAAIHELELNYNRLSITPSFYDLNPNYFNGKKIMKYFEFIYTYKYNNTDLRIFPTRGWDINISFSKKGLGIDHDVNQFMIKTQSIFYQKINEQLSTSTMLLARLAGPQQQPYYLQRALGFKNEFIRGYEYYVIDGTHYAILRNGLYYKLFDRIISQRVLPFLHYIPLRVFAKVYDDIGYVHSPIKKHSPLNNRILNGYGIGIDIVVSYLAKFRIEYSFNHLGQNGLFLHGKKD
ncbi:MAG: BamA/TamA family outer membrane protein [Chitinophagaceae bacterium]